MSTELQFSDQITEAGCMQALIDYSDTGEAIRIRQFLSIDAPRVVVDVHAGNRTTGSLSHALLDEGWKGLLVYGDLDSDRALLKDGDATAKVALWNQGSRNLTSLLFEHNIPEDFGLLVLNNGTSGFEVLKALDPRAFRPGLIVTKDSQTYDLRTLKYELLSSRGYKYASVAGEYSVWCRDSHCAPEAGWAQLATIPNLTEVPAGHAAFDVPSKSLQSCGALTEAVYLINGWAFVEFSFAVPPFVFLELHDLQTGRTECFQAHRCRRPDVSAHFGRDELLWSGFRAFLPLAKYKAGAFSIRVIQADDQHKYLSEAELRVDRKTEEYENLARLGLANKFLSGSGIEIGALQRPLSIPNGCQVRYVDRMLLTDLLAHYPEMKQFPIQAPDLIDDAESLGKIASASQDFVIANHFLEHCRNPFQTLSNLLRVVKRFGILFIAVPDKRYTFDFTRPSTSYEALKGAFETGTRAGIRELFREWVIHIEPGKDEGAIIARADELLAANYSIHYNVWNADELLTHLIQARTDFALPFQIVSVVCSDNEQILVLEKTGENLNSIRSNEPPFEWTGPEPEPSLSLHALPTSVEVSNTQMTSKETAISSISSSDSALTSSRYPTWKYVIPIPPDSLLWSVGAMSIENFLVVGDAWAQLVSRYTVEGATAVDIGCGCGRTARLLVNNKWITHYIGFDVIRENIEWCDRFIVPAFAPRPAKFHWFDLYSAEYNPNGPIRANELRFPCGDKEADVVFAASLFTHLLEPDCVHYLREVGRVLSARGTALLSIHNNVPAGTRFCGTETRIDIDSAYFAELANQAGLQESERIDDIGGQQVFVLKRLAEARR